MWPITIADVLQARERIRGTLAPTPFRRYAPLDELVGYGIRVFVKHENHQPTQAFKARNTLAALTSLSPEEKKRGVVAGFEGLRRLVVLVLDEDADAVADQLVEGRVSAERSRRQRAADSLPRLQDVRDGDGPHDGRTLAQSRCERRGGAGDG